MVSLGVLPENAVLAYASVRDTSYYFQSRLQAGSQFITVGLKGKMLRKRQALRPSQSVSQKPLVNWSRFVTKTWDVTSWSLMKKHAEDTLKHPFGAGQ